MAFVPEIDDPSKKDEDPNASDIQSQAASTPSAAPTSGAPAPGTNPAASATKSSGNFQDFSKFKSANQNKLSALSNMTLGQADKTVADAGSAFANAGAAYKTEIDKNAKNFGTSEYGKLNVNSKLDADKIGADLSAASQKTDVGSFQGKLAGDAAYTGLQSAENAVGNIGNRAGTANILGGSEAFKNSGASVDAANSDAMLLQSMGDYRTAANQKAQGVKGTTEKALTEQQGKLGQAATAVDAQNADYKKKALEALGKVKSDIDKDLSGKAKAQETARQAAINTKVGGLQEAARGKVASQIQALQATPPPQDTIPGNISWLPGGGPRQPNPNYAAEKAAYDGKMAEANRLSQLNPDQLLQEYGATDAIGEARKGAITADSVLKGDAQRQAQISALGRLLGGDMGYGKGGIAPTTDMSALDQLIQSLATKPKTAPVPPPVRQVVGAGANQPNGVAPDRIERVFNEDYGFDGNHTDITKGRY